MLSLNMAVLLVGRGGFEPPALTRQYPLVTASSLRFPYVQCPSLAGAPSRIECGEEVIQALKVFDVWKMESTSRLQLDVIRANTLICSLHASLGDSRG